jgi:hypothetical protein
LNGLDFSEIAIPARQSGRLPAGKPLPDAPAARTRKENTRPIGRPRLSCGSVTRSSTAPERSGSVSVARSIVASSISARRRMYDAGSATHWRIQSKISSSARRRSISSGSSQRAAKRRLK